MSTTITIGSNSYTLCAMPSRPGPADIEIGMNDTVAVVPSPFTRVEQVQGFPGADFWDATVTLPPMGREWFAPWRGFMAELGGRLNVLQLSDPDAARPLGLPHGTPVVASSGLNNLPMTNVLSTRGWAASAFRLLLPGDQFQIGYRLHMVTEIVNSDSSGNAALNIWPSLRETPADGTPLNYNKPAGLFRLAANRRAHQASPLRARTMSFKCVEVR